MKKALFFLLICSGFSLNAQSIYPPNWFSGMKNSQLQLLIHYPEIGKSSDWSSGETRIKIDSIVSLQNQNYLLIYLNLGEINKAFHFKMNYHLNGQRKEFSYSLLSLESSIGSALDEHDLLYLIKSDRFSNGDPTNDYPNGMQEKSNSRDPAYGRHGGDLKGIQNQLDYLKELGVTALWLDPVFENDEPLESYHGFAITNHYGIDPRLGDTHDYENLIDEMHQRKMKLVKEMVFNHIGDRNFLFRDLIDSAWFHWWPSFTRSNFRAPILMDPYASPEQKRIFNQDWFNQHMPDLNTSNIHLRKFLIQNTLWWVERYKIDALCIDTYAYPGASFIKEWYEQVHREFPELFVFGEIWDYGEGIQIWFGDKMNTEDGGLPSLTDFQLCRSIQHAFNLEPGWNTGLAEIYYTLAQDYQYSNARELITFLDKHDLPRTFGVFGRDTLKLQSALSVLLSTRGIPCLYYGTEQLMAATGNDNDKHPEWKGGWPGEKSPDKYHDSGTYYVIRTLAHLRKSHPAFDTDARFIQFTPQGGAYVYMREKNGHGVAVLVNTNSARTEIVLSQFPELYRAIGESEPKLSLYKVSLNRNAVFGLEQHEVVIFEW
ncbi:MAG: alpha-amylase [Bacteroidetes bacterium]|nr:alpha-amylase [Bacteroidota bacterium]